MGGSFNATNFTAIDADRTRLTSVTVTNGSSRVPVQQHIDDNESDIVEEVEQIVAPFEFQDNLPAPKRGKSWSDEELNLLASLTEKDGNYGIVTNTHESRHTYLVTIRNEVLVGHKTYG